MNSGGGNGNGNGNLPCNTSVVFQSNTTPNGTTLNASISGFSAWVTYTWSWNNGQVTHTSSPNTVAPTGASSVCLTVDDSICVDTYCDSFAVNSGGGTGTPCNLNEVVLALNFDNFAYETTWELIDDNGNVVHAGSGYTSANNATSLVETLCLPTGCYDFIIYDSYGDGICCAWGQGSYSLTDANGAILAAGGSFAYQDQTNICVGGATNPCGNFFGTFSYAVDQLTGDITFTPQMGAQGSMITWDLGDGSTSTAYSPTVNYTTNGVYNICMTATDSMGCTFTYCDSILITSNGNNNNNNPCAGLSLNINMVQDSADPFTIWMQPVVNGAAAGTGFDFIWDFGDNTGAISGMPTHFYNNYGTYTVCLMAIDTIYGCAATFCDTIMIDSSGNFSRNMTKPGLNVNILSPVINTVTSVKTVNDNPFDMALFPNPAGNVINVSLSSESMADATITILDVSGKTVQHQVATLDEGAQTITLDVEQLPAGVYFVNLTSEDAQNTMKFIKK